MIKDFVAMVTVCAVGLGLTAVIASAPTTPKDRLPDGFVELELPKKQAKIVINSQQFIWVKADPKNKKKTLIFMSDGREYISDETLEDFLNKVRNQQR